MANFPGAQLTDQGRQLQSKAQIGTALTFTRVALGDGSSSNWETMTGLGNEMLSLSIQDHEVVGDGTSRLRVIMTNENLANGFFVRELGVFARDLDTGDELLYSYTNAGNQPDFLPAGSGASMVENVFDLYTVIGNAQSVTAVISDYITIATKQDIDEIRPLLVPEGGTVNQMMRKASNSEGDTEWFTPEEGIGVQVESREERRVAVEGQRTFSLSTVTTQGLAVYLNGERLGRHRWQPLGGTQMRFNSELADGDEVLFVQNEEVGEIDVARVSLTGDNMIYPGTENTYVITDYDAFADYEVSSDRGTVSRDSNIITITLDPDEPDGSLDLNITRDSAGITYAIAVGAPRARTPQIISPSDGDDRVDLQPTFVSTNFATYPADFDSHAGSTWLVARDYALTDIVLEVSSAAALTEFKPDSPLPIDEDLFVSVIHTGSELGDSDPSPVVAFHTTDQWGFLFSGDENRNVQRHPLPDFVTDATLNGLHGAILGMDFGDDGFLYAAGGLRAYKIRVDPFEIVDTYTGINTYNATCLAYGKNGYVYVGNSGGYIHRIDTTSMTGSYSSIADESIQGLAVGPDGYLYVGLKATGTNILKLDPDSLNQVASNGSRNGWTWGLGFGPDGYLYSTGGSSENQVIKIDPQTMSQVGNLSEHTDSSQAITFDTSGHGYSCGNDGEVHKIQLADMSLIGRYTGHLVDAQCITFGLDGFIYSGDRSGEIHKIDPLDMSQVSIYPASAAPIRALVWNTGLTVLEEGN